MQLSKYHFDGEIIGDPEQGYTQGYLDFPFDVPEQVGALRLRLDYDPQHVNHITNLLTLGLYDPAGFRGNAHRQPPDAVVNISPSGATAGFLPGPIRPGRWLAQLAMQSILADSRPCRYSLDIELLPAAAQPAQAPAPAPAPHPAGGRPGSHPGWYRGELHSHTIHSDGEFTVDGLIAEAHNQGLDFLVLSDHNTTSGLAEAASADLNGLLFLPGMELTTFCGHALAIGVSGWVDWRTDYQGWTMADAARQVHEMGGVFIVAHPGAIGSPFCTGCRWEFPEFDLDLADAIEVWNGGWGEEDNYNPNSLRQWQQQQEQGRRITATAGSDAHKPKDWRSGTPRAYIRAAKLAAPEILEGIRQGRVEISSGPWLSLRAAPNDEVAEGDIGDTIGAPDGQVTVSAGWEDAPEEARLILCGKAGVRFSEPAAGNGSFQRELPVQPGERLWLELTAGDGTLLALTNPVFIE